MSANSHTVESAAPHVAILEAALEKIVQMNLQTAHDKYGDHAKAYSWSCVRVAQEALGRKVAWAGDENRPPITPEQQSIDYRRFRDTERHVTTETRALADRAAAWLMSNGHEVKAPTGGNAIYRFNVRPKGRKGWTSANSYSLISYAKRAGWDTQEDVEAC